MHVEGNGVEFIWLERNGLSMEEMDLSLDGMERMELNKDVGVDFVKLSQVLLCKFVVVIWAEFVEICNCCGSEGEFFEVW